MPLKLRPVGISGVGFGFAATGVPEVGLLTYWFWQYVTPILNIRATPALFTLAALGMAWREYRAWARFARIGEVPFSSERKLMSTVHDDAERELGRVLFTKGAPDVLLPRCSHELVGESAVALAPTVVAEVDRTQVGVMPVDWAALFRADPNAKLSPLMADLAARWAGAMPRSRREPRR